MVTADGKRLFNTTVGADEKQDVAWLDLTGDHESQSPISSATPA